MVYTKAFLLWRRQKYHHRDTLRCVNPIVNTHIGKVSFEAYIIKILSCVSNKQTQAKQTKS